MTTTPDDDPDPVDRARGVDLGEEYLLLAAYNLGVADGRPMDWRAIAPRSPGRRKSAERMGCGAASPPDHSPVNAARNRSKWACFSAAAW